MPNVNMTWLLQTNELLSYYELTFIDGIYAHQPLAISRIFCLNMIAGCPQY